MSWLARLIARLRLQLPTPVDPNAVKGERVIGEADRVLEDYRKQDAALRLVVVKKR